MLPFYRVSAPAYRLGVFHRKRFPYTGYVTGSVYMRVLPILQNTLNKTNELM